MASPALTGGTATPGAGGQTAATSHAVICGSIDSAGLLFILFGRVAAAGTVSISETSGQGGTWTVVQDSSDASDDVTFWAYRNQLTTVGNVGTNLAISVTHGSAKMSCLGYYVSGAQDPAIQAPQSSTVAIGTTTTSADATIVTPTGGSKDYLFLACVGLDGEAATLGTNPAGYTSWTVGSNNSGTAGAVATNCWVGVAYKQATAASEDAGAWALSAAPATAWTALTLAIHPAPVTAKSKRYFSRSQQVAVIRAATR